MKVGEHEARCQSDPADSSIYNDDSVHHPVAAGATAAPDTVCVHVVVC